MTPEETAQELHDRGFHSEPDLCKPVFRDLYPLPKSLSLGFKIREEIDQAILGTMFQCPDCGGLECPCRGPHGAD